MQTNKLSENNSEYMLSLRSCVKDEEWGINEKNDCVAIRLALKKELKGKVSFSEWHQALKEVIEPSKDPISVSTHFYPI